MLWKLLKPPEVMRCLQLNASPPLSGSVWNGRRFSVYTRGLPFHVLTVRGAGTGIGGSQPVLHESLESPTTRT